MFEKCPTVDGIKLPVLITISYDNISIRSLKLNDECLASFVVNLIKYLLIRRVVGIRSDYTNVSRFSD